MFVLQIRISDADLAKERGVVLEEWRQHRDATGRMQEAYWALLTKGSRVRRPPRTPPTRPVAPLS